MMNTTETIPDNCVLLTPQEAAELYANRDLFVYVVRDGKVHYRQLFDAGITPIRGTVLSIVGIEDGSRYLCIFSDEKEKVLRLRDQLLEEGKVAAGCDAGSSVGVDRGERAIQEVINPKKGGAA